MVRKALESVGDPESGSRLLLDREGQSTPETYFRFPGSCPRTATGRLIVVLKYLKTFERLNGTLRGNKMNEREPTKWRRIL